MEYAFILGSSELVGGFVGEAIQDSVNAIRDGIIYAFQYVVLSSVKIVSTLCGASILGSEMIYFASKDGKDKGKIVKYILIYVGTKIVEIMIRAIS